jgi:hypothetical protein
VARGQCALYAASGDRSVPASPLERFAGNADQALMRLLVFLRPITVGTTALREGR